MSQLWLNITTETFSILSIVLHVRIVIYFISFDFVADNCKFILQ